MKNRNNPTMIFLRAWKHQNDNVENQRAHIALMVALGQDLIETVGVYKGTMGMSVGVVLSEVNTMSRVLTLASAFRQESVLLVKPNLDAELLYIDSGLTEKLDGKFKQVTQEQAEKLENYTYAHSFNKSFWAVV